MMFGREERRRERLRREGFEDALVVGRLDPTSRPAGDTVSYQRGFEKGERAFRRMVNAAKEDGAVLNENPTTCCWECGMIQPGPHRGTCSKSRMRSGGPLPRPIEGHALCITHGRRGRDGHRHGRCNAIVRYEGHTPILCGEIVFPVDPPEDPLRNAVICLGEIDEVPARIRADAEVIIRVNEHGARVVKSRAHEGTELRVYGDVPRSHPGFTGRERDLDYFAKLYFAARAASGGEHGLAESALDDLREALALPPDIEAALEHRQRR